MDHIEIIQAMVAGDCLFIRDAAEAKRTGRPQEACLAGGGPVAMAHAQRAVANPAVYVVERTKPIGAPDDWKPDGVCYGAEFADA